MWWSGKNRGAKYCLGSPFSAGIGHVILIRSLRSLLEALGIYSFRFDPRRTRRKNYFPLSMMNVYLTDRCESGSLRVLAYLTLRRK